METPRRMQSGSRGGSSPLPPPFPTTGRQLAHWPVQTPPGASRVSPFRPSPQRHRDAPPRGRTLRPLPGHEAGPPPGCQGDTRRLPRRPALSCPTVQATASPPPFCPCPPDSRTLTRSPRNTVGSWTHGEPERATGWGCWKAIPRPSPLSAENCAHYPDCAPLPHGPNRRKRPHSPRPCRPPAHRTPLLYGPTLLRFSLLSRHLSTMLPC